MASDMSSIWVHEPKHSHQPVATQELLKSSDNQSLSITEIEDSIMTDQVGTQGGIQQSQSSETVDPQSASNAELIPTQKLLASPCDQIVSKTGAKDIIMTDEADVQERMQQMTSTASEDVQSISEEFIWSNQKLMPKPRKEIKRTSKRTKKQNPRIAEPTSQADLDGDSPRGACVESQTCREKDPQDPRTKLQEVTVQLKPPPRELRPRKNQLSHARDDFQKVREVQQELASVRRELEASQDDLHRTQNTCKGLQKANRKLAASQVELTACKDELFRLQPIAQIPDSRVAKEFENLCQQVVNWIDVAVAIFKMSHPEDGPEHLFSIGEDKEAAEFMRQNPIGGEHLAAHMIHRWLLDNLFGQKFSCLGLPAEAIQLLERAEQSLARLDPPRDSTTIAAWRSETLNALTSTEECEKARIRETQDMNGRLFKELSKTLPVLFTRSETDSSFYIQILLPAVNLAKIIQLSTARYAWGLQKGILRKWPPISKDILKYHKIMDMKTGKCLKPDSLVTADQQGSIWTAVLMVEPSMRDSQGNTLKQGTVVAILISLPKKRDKPSA